MEFIGETRVPAAGKPVSAESEFGFVSYPSPVDVSAVIRSSLGRLCLPVLVIFHGHVSMK